MSRYPGRILSSTAPTVSANSAKGIWTLDEAMRYIRAGQWPVPTGGGDPYFQYNTMLLPGQGTNGAQNNTFLDSSTNNFTITRNGNTTQGTFTPFSNANGNWSVYNSGSSYLSVADNAAFNLSGTPFTIEAWVYHVADSGAYTNWVVGKRGAGSPFTSVWALSISSTNFVEFGTTGYTWGVTSSFPIQRNTWNHIAGTYDGTSVRLYVNGVLAAGPTAATVSDVGAAVTIGNYTVGANPVFTGFISNLRIVKGTAVYTSNFTPSTTPLTAVSGTSLLTCQSNRFVDNSTNAFAITVNSTPQITPFQPFGAPISAYSASTIGGSGYFDGTADYLTAPADNAFGFGTGDFKIEMWIYPTAISAGDVGLWYVDQTGGLVTAFVSTTGYLAIGTRLTSYDLTSSYKPALNTWTHVVFSRVSGTGYIFANGTQVATGSLSSKNYLTSVSGLAVTAGNFGNNPAGSAYFQGYISGLVVVKGSGVTSVTVPTAPPTPATGTSLLTNFTNAGIIDNAQDNNLETVGNAQISTTQYKWGASSMYFDGTGDWVLAPSSQNIAMGTGDFTIEFWMYLTGVSGEGTTVYNSTSGGINLFMNISSNWGIARSGVGVDNNFGTPPAQNQWNHIVVNRTASVIKAFINGNQVFAGANTSNYVAGPIQIGGSSFGTITGYINDLRITKGYARYPYNFTAPTAALPLFWQAAATPSSDPYFDYTTLLLPGNGTNGAQNNTFLDSSTNAFTITRNGNTTQGTFTPFSQTGWSNYLNSGDSLAFSEITQGATWTIEFWYSINATGNNIVTFRSSSAGDWIGIYASDIRYAYGANTRTFDFTSAVNTWYHVALVNNSSNLTCYVNGVKIGTTQTGPSTSYVSKIGGYGAGFQFAGYLSNLRITNTAVYSSNFIPSTAPLTAISGTQLLTCQSNRFIDNSTNAYAITLGGSPSVQAFSPFNPTAAYSTSTVGGSGYFDGTGDYLSVSNNALIATGDFTMEAWCYTTRNNAYQGIISSGDSSNTAGARIVQGNTGNVEFWVNGQANTSTALPINQWNHVAIVRSGSGSNNISCYLNGTRLGQLTQTSSTTNNTVVVGRYYNNGTDQYHWLGYIADARFVVGSAVYSGATYTVPTAPLTAVTNTQLLLSGTNGGIIDNTAKNNLETVGGASISTTVSKFGGSSMYFDGTGDWLDILAANQLSNFSSGDWTIEAWIYRSTASANHCILNFINSAGTNAGLTFQVSSSNQLVSDNGTVAALAAGTVPSNQWVHIAIARYSGTTTGYINGVAVGTTTQAPSASQYLRIGALGNGGYAYHGYINDLRVTKGIARYTQNFTPPATAFLTL